MFNGLFLLDITDKPMVGAKPRKARLTATKDFSDYYLKEG